MDYPSYWELGDSEPGPEKTSYFVLDSLLKSRVDCGFESRENKYDEDVNVYLVHLLSQLVAGPGLSQMAADRALDVFARVSDSMDLRHKSVVYRTTADQLLITTSLFTQTPFAEQNGQRVFQPGAWDQIERGKEYYRYAAAYQERLPSGSPTMPHVLNSLSRQFENYVQVLFHMRGEYFHLFERIKEDQLQRLAAEEPGDVPMPELNADELNVLRDEFLDAFSAWSENPTNDSRRQLERAVSQLRAADPAFQFEMPN